MYSHQSFINLIRYIRIQEREARLETKRKNDRSSIVFAFGSSTPRMLEPAETPGGSYWASRRLIQLIISITM